MLVSDVVWQDVADKKLSGLTFRVFCFIATRAKMNNRFELTQKAVADAMEVSEPVVSKAFRELREAGYIIRIKEPGGMSFWHLDARRVFRGSASRHQSVVERQRKARRKLEGDAPSCNVVELQPKAEARGMSARDAAKFEENFRRARLELEAEA